MFLKYEIMSKLNIKDLLNFCLTNKNNFKTLINDGFFKYGCLKLSGKIALDQNCKLLYFRWQKSGSFYVNDNLIAQNVCIYKKQLWSDYYYINFLGDLYRYNNETNVKVDNNVKEILIATYDITFIITFDNLLYMYNKDKKTLCEKNVNKICFPNYKRNNIFGQYILYYIDFQNVLYELKISNKIDKIFLKQNIYQIYENNYYIDTKFQLYNKNDRIITNNVKKIVIFSSYIFGLTLENKSFYIDHSKIHYTNLDSKDVFPGAAIAFLDNQGNINEMLCANISNSKTDFIQMKHKIQYINNYKLNNSYITVHLDS